MIVMQWYAIGPPAPSDHASSSVISPGALAMQFGSRVLESLVAPVVQWFDNGKQMGDLRPAA